MVVKKKTAKVETVALDRATLEKLTASLSVDGDPGAQKLAQNLLDCLRLTDPVLQIQQVKKVANLLEELSEGPSPADGLLLSCLDTLAVMYTSLQSKNPLKRAVASTLSSVPAWLHGQAASRLSACLSDCLSSAGPERYPHLTDTLASCLDGFPLGERCIHTLLTEVLQFFHKALCEYLQQNSGLAGRHVAQAQVMQACLSAVKASMLVVQRSQEPVSAALLAESPPSPCPLRDTLNALLACYTRILTDEEFVQTVQSTAGMAVVLLTRCMLGSGDKVAEVVASLLLGPEQGADSAPVWLQESCAGLYRGDRPPAVSLFLCHGALAMLSWRGGPLGPEGERLLLLIPSALLALDTSVKESSTAMVVSRVLALWSSVALDGLQGAPSSSGLWEALLGRAELPGRLQEHIQAHWEHPLDGVRHQTRALFRNLLRLHQACAGVPDPASDPFVTELTHSLLGLEWHVRGKYASLACLVEHLGTGRLLALHPALPSCLLSLMDDQSLAPHAGDLLERLFVSHKAQLSGRDQTGAEPESGAEAVAGAEPGAGAGWMEEWNRTWVTPLLDVLCQARLDQTTYILDYLLPKLLRCCPASLAHMVQVLQNAQFGTSGSPGSRGALGALMTCLRAARAHGVDHLAEGGFLGGLVSHSLLQQALLHKHDQVRMDALGLVCESHRSTETVSREEIDLIRHFLPSNLNSQSPGVRQQTVSLLKKLLGRVKDSAQLLQKRLGQERGETAVKEGDRSTLEMYQDFLHWFCETLFEVLAPGASFPTCLTALHLLGLVADLFTFSTGPASFALGDTVSHAHAQAVLYCLASNFLEVKQLASTLLRKLPPQTVGLREPSRMRSLLRVALDLSTSTKPFDSVTAAHLLGLLAHQEELMDALAHCAQEQGIPFQPPVPGELHASSASTLEKNTLGVVQVLLLCLRAEVERAEASLLQAAASYPLYGRAHCITAALKQLPAGSLSLKDQWRTVVADLITTFYRMSDVVSPVVQSSSPEGLIPMDTDSETSAGLQKILQEIQPRDTNDFFTDARETQAGGQPGHIPQSENTGGSGEGYRVTAQMVLVCCWRSMKEVSMLLGQVCQDMPLQTREACRDGIITEGQVEGVGRYFRQQLLQSRHRGAFELAYVGFVRLTDMLCRSGSQSLQQLPSHWLKEVLEEVKSSDPSSKLCATRRSAGIPFYIQALLSSEPKSSSCSLLKMTMKELTSLAMPDPQHLTNRSTVPQVHALNILRALYRDTRLGENIVPFVSDGVQAAVLGFTSPIWAVRNSSTLLFSTLITRIFGVKKGKDEHSKKNRMTGREFFTRFPALYPFLLGQLEEAAGSVDSDSGEVKLHPSLFLLLLILGRLYPSPMDGSSSPLGLAPFMPFIIRCGRSAVYRTREMAARALVPFVLVTQVPSTIRALLEDLPLELGPGTQQNHIHGTLLQVLHLLRSYESDTHRPRPGGIGQDSDITAALRARLWLAGRRNPCLVTRAAFLDLLMSLCGSALASAVDPELTALCEETLEVLTDSELLAPDGPVAVTGPGATQYLQSLARVAASASTEDPELWGAGSRGPRILGCLLQCPQYEVRHLALEAVLRRLERAADTPGDPGPAHYSFTSMALHERHPQCLTKVLQVLSGLPWSSVLPWRDGTRALTNEEALTWLMTLAEDSVHSVELHCAALALLSRLMVRLMDTAPQGRGVAAVSVLSRWGALVSRCCSEEQPEEVKLTAAEVLVKAMPSLLASPALPLGVRDTVALWRSLFILLQDEDLDVRDRASDFTATVQTQLLHNKYADVAPAALCPPVALDLGVGLLCQLLQVWEQVPAGVLVLTEWLLGEGEPEAGGEDTSRLDEYEEEFLFEKGELNLWAEPLRWARLLHRHLLALLRVPGVASGVAGTSRAELDRLRTLAGDHAHTARQRLHALPPLPQFSSTIDHARLDVQRERAELALEVLKSLIPAAQSH
ncbi:thyroid adenoma-associated protein [Anguilla anguilla]|uniref:thyroid adenoma-associated protein n=1 Tax=Anguilla anguilla TaxID=7936 RepID=UPI0015A92298|nr:thyroid adenoma-associated protein [Anguilla anguilla]XP_035256756.1 thyroid adenoma-associated protein [Anguilla anguilla]